MPERQIVQFNFRCPVALVELIDQDIEATGEYRNRSEWTIAAIRNFVEYRARVVAERKTAYESNDDFITAPSGSLQPGNDEVKE